VTLANHKRQNSNTKQFPMKQTAETPLSQIGDFSILDLFGIWRLAFGI
jgi:hypothetical protein